VVGLEKVGLGCCGPGCVRDTKLKTGLLIDSSINVVLGESASLKDWCRGRTIVGGLPFENKYSWRTSVVDKQASLQIRFIE